MILILSGISCVGKTTQANILKKNYGFKSSISYTTREPRINEINGIDYNFISKNEFQKKIEENFFIEFTQKFDNFYGTSIEDINNIKNDFNIVMCLCCSGFINIRNIFPDDVVGIYLLPPCKDELINRFLERGTNEIEIKKRINKIFEICENESKFFNYTIASSNIKNVTKQILDIIN